MLSSEYRGHQLVEKRSPRGHTVYKVPEKLAQESISEIIRAVDREGWTRAEISEVTGIRYQHVRNVLERDRSLVAQPDREDAIDVGQVGSQVAFVDLVGRVESGRDITIMRAGRLVARLVAIRGGTADDPVAEACRRMDALAEQASLGDVTIRELIDDGRNH